MCVSQFKEASLNGWSGEPAVFPVAQECRRGSDSAITHFLQMEDATA